MDYPSGSMPSTAEQEVLEEADDQDHSLQNTTAFSLVTEDEISTGYSPGKDTESNLTMDEQEERLALRLSERSQEELGRQAEILGQPVPENSVGGLTRDSAAGSEHPVQITDLPASVAGYEQQAPEDVQSRLAMLESQRAVIPSDVYEKQMMALLFELMSLRSGIEFSFEASQMFQVGTSLLEQAMRENDLELVKSSTTALKTAADLTLDGHPAKPAILTNLGSGFSSRFERFGELGDLVEAIYAFRRAVDLTPDGHPDKPNRLNNLGNVLTSRFERLDDLADIEEAIHTCRRAVELAPDDHSEKPIYFSNLGNGLSRRFQRLGELVDVEEAIQAYRRALDLTLEGDPDMPQRFSNLGSGFLYRFLRLGGLVDIEKSIDAYHHAVDLNPDSHPDKPKSLYNLGNGFLARFHRLGDLADIEDAANAYRRAVHLSPDDHPDKLSCLNNLGVGLSSRFSQLGELADIEEAIHVFRRALDLSPDGHSNRPGCFYNLARGLKTRFQRRGELADIKEAIQAYRCAIDSTPDGHPDMSDYYNDLGDSFLIRFQHLGELADLEQAMYAYHRAVELTPDDHPNKPNRLDNLGSGFFFRFDRLGELRDIEEAISTFRSAVDLTPDGHPEQPSRLSSLASGLSRHFERLGELAYIEEAMQLYRHAIDLTPNGHPKKPGRFNNLGASYFIRFKRLGELVDIEEAINTYRRAVDLTPDSDPVKPIFLSNLGNGLFMRFERLGEASDAQAALEAYFIAANQQSASPGIRLQAIRASESVHQVGLRQGFSTLEKLIDVYERGMALIPQVAWLGNSVGQRFEELSKIGQLVNGAVAAAITAGQHVRAVEWLEEGRSVVWSQLIRLRSPLDKLDKIRPDLAKDLQILSRDLERSSGLTNNRSSQETPAERNIQDEASERISVAQKYQSTLDRIREVEGFEHFLMPTPFSSLSRCSENGLVALINIHDTRCDALVLCPAERIIHVPLPEFTPEIANSMHTGFVNHLPRRPARGAAQEDRRNGASWDVDLEYLWSCVVQPILQAIDDEHAWPHDSNGELPHITWCPTGPLSSLPLHAAGNYRSQKTGMKTFERVVSSYSPSLSALLRPAIPRTFSLSRSENVLIISQPQTLQAVEREVELVKDVLAECNVFHLDREEATVDASLAALASQSPQILHLACHRIQNAEDPTKSAFILADGAPLELSRLMSVTTDGAALAVLSACQTATGDENLPEEAVHLTAGMLSVGYSAVVGTIWSIADEDAPDVAKEFYAELKRELYKREEMENRRWRVAYALHIAVAKLREQVGVSNVARWAPYVHFGQ